MVSAVGVSNLQYVNLNSSRNLFIFGFSVFFGLSFPRWMNQHQDVIDTGQHLFCLADYKKSRSALRILALARYDARTLKNLPPWHVLLHYFIT